MTDFTPFLEATVRTATPLLIAAVGENVSERAGVINIGLEGCIIAGAFAAFAAGAVSPVAGYGAAMVAGVVVGVLAVVFIVLLGRDQIIVGTALTMLALGVTGTLFRARGEALAVVPTYAPSVMTYLAIVLVPLSWWWLNRTQSGLALRAIGDAPSAARAAGVRVRLVQSGAVLFGAALGGLAGGTLVLAQAGSFAEGMSAGRGFLAIAIVALGRWRSGGVALASLVFGAAMALQFVVQALGWRVRYELVLMIPYVLTLIALGAFGRGSAPAMLGRPLPED
jgi:simple sugar transport system permease protein